MLSFPNRLVWLKSLRRLIFWKFKLNHITPLLKQLQWLPRSLGMKPKYFAIAYKTPYNMLIPTNWTLDSHLILLNCFLDFIYNDLQELSWPPLVTSLCFSSSVCQKWSFPKLSAWFTPSSFPWNLFSWKRLLLTPYFIFSTGVYTLPP